MDDGASAAIDLSAVMPSDTSAYEMKAPGTGAPTGWKITLAGPGHAKAIAWSNEQQRKGLRRQAQIEAQQANGRKIKAEDRDLDEVRRDNIGWVVSRILDWTPVKIEGEVFAFSDESAAKLLLKPTMGWAFVQLIDALADERTFTPRSASN